MGKHLVRAESFLTSFLEEHGKDRNAQPVREGALLRRSSSQTVFMEMWLLSHCFKRPCLLLHPFVFVILLVATIGLTLPLSSQRRRAGCTIMGVLVGISWLQQSTGAIPLKGRKIYLAGFQRFSLYHGGKDVADQRSRGSHGAGRDRGSVNQLASSPPLASTLIPVHWLSHSTCTPSLPLVSLVLSENTL